MMRIFGESDQSTALLLEQLSPSSYVDVVIAGRPFRKFSKRIDVNLQAGPNFAAYEREVQLGDFGRYEPALLFGSIAPELPPELQVATSGDKDAEPQEEAVMVAPGAQALSKEVGDQISWLEVVQRNRKVRLATGSLGPAFDAMNKCTDNLMQSWGIDTSEFEEVVMPARWVNLKDVARKIQRDYPSKALKRGASANFRMRLFIDETGKVTDCKMLALTKDDGFGDAPCRTMTQDAVFEPALDARGQPVKSYSMQGLRYVAG